MVMMMVVMMMMMMMMVTVVGNGYVGVGDVTKDVVMLRYRRHHGSIAARAPVLLNRRQALCCARYVRRCTYECEGYFVAAFQCCSSRIINVSEELRRAECVCLSAVTVVTATFLR